MMDDRARTASNQPTLAQNSCQPRALGNCIGSRPIVWLRRWPPVYHNTGMNNRFRDMLLEYDVT
jgi:hypothetical protein